jgi:hypothetical protein
MPTDRFPLNAYDDFLSDESELEDDICACFLKATPQGQGPQAHRTNASNYPGNVLECMQEEAPPSFPAQNLWCNQPAKEKEMYYKRFRMDKPSFRKLLQIASPALDEVRPSATIIKGQHSYAHQDILAMTLHCLVHETLFRVMQFAFGRPGSSIAKLVRLGLTALYKTMWKGLYRSKRFVQYHSDDKGKGAVIAGFQKFVDGLPHCAGAIDGCLIQMSKPSTKHHRIAMLISRGRAKQPCCCWPLLMHVAATFMHMSVLLADVVMLSRFKMDKLERDSFLRTPAVELSVLWRANSRKANPALLGRRWSFCALHPHGEMLDDL